MFVNIQSVHLAIWDYSPVYFCISAKKKKNQMCRRWNPDTQKTNKQKKSSDEIKSDWANMYFFATKNYLLFVRSLFHSAQ